MTRKHGEFFRPRTVAEALGQSLDYEPGAVWDYILPLLRKER
jgi:hypothetical protein